MALSQPIRGLLGLARRAGAVAVGDMATRDAIRRGRAALVLVAADAGLSTLERFARLAGRAGVPAFKVGNREELGGALGLDGRAVLAICSRDFARGLLVHVQQEGEALPSLQGPGQQ